MGQNAYWAYYPKRFVGVLPHTACLGKQDYQQNPCNIAQKQSLLSTKHI